MGTKYLSEHSSPLASVCLTSELTLVAWPSGEFLVHILVIGGRNEVDISCATNKRIHYRARVPKHSSTSAQGKRLQTSTGKAQGNTCHGKVVVDRPETGTRQAPEQHSSGDHREGQSTELLWRVIQEPTTQTLNFNHIFRNFLVSKRG